MPSLGIALLFGATAVANHRRWRIAQFINGALGLLFVLYAMAVMLIGVEDVGGFGPAVALAALTGAMGAWSFAEAILPLLHPTMPGG